MEFTEIHHADKLVIFFFCNCLPVSEQVSRDSAEIFSTIFISLSCPSKGHWKGEEGKWYKYITSPWGEWFQIISAAPRMLSYCYIWQTHWLKFSNSIIVLYGSHISLQLEGSPGSLCINQCEHDLFHHFIKMATGNKHNNGSITFKMPSYSLLK